MTTKAFAPFIRHPLSAAAAIVCAFAAQAQTSPAAPSDGDQ